MEKPFEHVKHAHYFLPLFFFFPFFFKEAASSLPLVRLVSSLGGNSGDCGRSTGLEGSGVYGIISSTKESGILLLDSVIQMANLFQT